MSGINGCGGGDDYNMTLARAEGERDRQNSASQAFRDMAEMALTGPLKIAGALGEVLKTLLGGLSG